MVKHIRTLWRGDKGRLPTQLELPPLTADGIGFPFAVSEGRHELCLCNQTHLLLWRKIHQKAEFLGAFQPEAAVKAQFWGVASDSEGWVVVYQEADKLWVALLDARLRWRDRIPLRGYLKDYNLAPPLRVASHRDRVYLADTQSLVIVDRKGHTDAVRSCPYGYALQEILYSAQRSAARFQPHLLHWLGHFLKERTWYGLLRSQSHNQISLTYAPRY